ncbi:hypothetical protein [Candidatus Rhabdochlamydia sp. W815]|uniref:hypothetical protein n=1 Tax=Candidatus Rhabdochlamydia sp. W815 TaxID=2720721 RepID=UPI001BFC48C3|nr:hypothetical protein [Candidatus Rhabdochlamydia sp. W815]
MEQLLFIKIQKSQHFHKCWGNKKSYEEISLSITNKGPAALVFSSWIGFLFFSKKITRFKKRKFLNGGPVAKYDI